MKRFKQLLTGFYLFGAVLVAWAQGFPRERSFIAEISGIDQITDIHVRNLLHSNGIPSTAEGSVVYGIEVPATQTNEAIRILKSDTQIRGYIQFRATDVVLEPEKKELVSRLRLEEVLTRPMFASNTPLGIFLRSKSVNDLRSKYPVVTYLNVHQRQYLSTTNVFKTGYDVEIALSVDLKSSSSGYRGRYQVYDEGREIAFLGANEWSGRKSE